MRFQSLRLVCWALKQVRGLFSAICWVSEKMTSWKIPQAKRWRLAPQKVWKSDRKWPIWPIFTLFFVDFDQAISEWPDAPTKIFLVWMERPWVKDFTCQVSDVNILSRPNSVRLKVAVLHCKGVQMPHLGPLFWPLWQKIWAFRVDQAKEQHLNA